MLFFLFFFIQHNIIYHTFANIIYHTFANIIYHVYYMRFLYLISLSILAYSCVKVPRGPVDPTPDTPDEPTAEISLSNSDILLSAGQTEKSITIYSSDDWSLGGGGYTASWCTPSVKKGNSGTTDVTFSISANNTGQTRSTQMYFTCKNEKATLCISQYPFSLKSSIIITLPSGVTDVKSVVFSPLKYNKSMAYSFVAADGNNRPWSKLFKYIQGKYVNSGAAWHHNMKQTSDGFQPSRTLTYTDGCGVERRFTMGNSIVPIKDRKDGEYPLEKQNPNIYYPYLVWDEVYDMLDFDGSIQLHNMREEGSYNPIGNFFDKTDPEQVLLGLQEVQQYIKKNIGRNLSVLAVPDGNKNYSIAGGNFQDVMMMTGSGFPSNVNLLTANINKLTHNIYIKDDFELHKNNFDKQYAMCNASYYGWVIDVTHNVDEAFTSNDLRAQILDYVYDSHGEKGKDDVWIATPDEVIQYLWGKENTPLTYSVSDGKLTISIDVSNQNNNIYWKEYTLLIDGLTYTQDLKIEYGTDVIGFSANKAPNGTMINVNYDLSLLQRAEKYTSKYESSGSDEDKKDALYFIQRLSPVKASSFSNRIK